MKPCLDLSPRSGIRLTALQDLIHDIWALCQAGAEQNAPSARGSQPLCSSSLGPMPRLPQSFPCRKYHGSSRGTSFGGANSGTTHSGAAPSRKPHPKTSMPPSPWIPLLHLPHTPL
ncbi:unnamed protein product, partial [Staurois parvus]